MGLQLREQRRLARADRNVAKNSARSDGPYLFYSLAPFKKNNIVTAFVPCAKRDESILHDDITALEVNSVAVMRLKPNLTLVHHGVIHRICLVHRGIFSFEVIGQSRQATQ